MFWAVKLDMALEMFMLGNMARESIFVAAVYPATSTLPKELTRPCIIIMERDTRDCWSMEGRPIWAIRFTATMWKRGSFTPCFSGSQGIRRIRRSNTSREATAQRPWAISVAHATPATPMPKRITNSRSSTMFVRLEIIRKIRGVLLSPWAL